MTEKEQTMTENVGDLTLSTIRFDKQGDVDAAGEAALRQTLDTIKPTDLIVFSHGWNNSEATAHRLYEAFFGRVASLLAAHPVPDRTATLLGVFWPSELWSDEPIPDFTASPDLGGNQGGGAAFAAAPTFAPPAPPDDATAAVIQAAFPADAKAAVDELIDLLRTRPDDQAALDRAAALIAQLAAADGPDDDGEAAAGGPLLAQPDSGPTVFADFAAKLEESGVDTTQGAGGAAGFGSSLHRLWSGAQEVARQLTYWQMKKRAGVVGQHGLGPLLGRLLAENDALHIHLVGHSFGARLVSYSLLGLPDTVAGRPPIAGLTLLEGAFSHYAFADALPFAPDRGGALKGQEAKVSGPVVACYSQYDGAVGTFYPLASMTARDDAAAFSDVMARWGGMGHDGHQPRSSLVGPVDLADAGTPYTFPATKLVNIDAARVVKKGSPPSGAHSDIVHDELAWVVLSAGELVP